MRGGEERAMGGGWGRVRWSEAGQVLELLEASPAGDGPEASASPESYFAALRTAGRRMEAAEFLGQALPRLEAVAWAAHTVRDTLPPAPAAQPEARALRAVLFWLQDPTDHRRRAAWEAARACSRVGPEAMVAYAAFFSGGSMAPADLQPVPAPKHATGLMATGAVRAAAVAADGAKESLDRALDAGDRLARSGYKAA